MPSSLADRDPEMLRRLARKLSDRMGAVVLLLGVEESKVIRFVVFERGRIMDEYLSVPEYHGDLQPGDVIALQANPTVVARLTGADPADIRRVVRTAKRPEELPPAGELIREVAAVQGVEGAEHGYAAASSIEQIRVSRPVLLEKSRRSLDVREERKVTVPAGSSRALTARSCHRAAAAQRRSLRAAAHGRGSGAGSLAGGRQPGCLPSRGDRR